MTYMTNFSPDQKTHLYPRFECSVHQHGSGASLLLNYDETLSTGLLRVSVHCELRIAPRLCVQLYSPLFRRWMRTRRPCRADPDETWSEDAVLRVVAKKAKQREPLTGFLRRPLVAALVRDLP